MAHRLHGRSERWGSVFAKGAVGSSATVGAVGSVFAEGGGPPRPRAVGCAAPRAVGCAAPEAAMQGRGAEKPRGGAAPKQGLSRAQIGGGERGGSLE